MAQTSRAKNTNNPIAVFESQIRECYGRVVYTHKAHEKCSDILNSRHNLIEVLKIILSACSAASFISLFFGTEMVGKIVGTIVSTILLCLNAYTKDFKLGELAQKHKQAANSIWLIREEYLSLLTDIKANILTYDKAAERRDSLMNDYHKTLEAAPPTNSEAYSKAQRALQINEDMTFSDSEIDKLLPAKIRNPILSEFDSSSPSVTRLLE